MPRLEYERINWEDAPSTETPISAENLNIMDNAIAALSSDLGNLENRVDNLSIQNASNMTATFGEPGEVGVDEAPLQPSGSTIGNIVTGIHSRIRAVTAAIQNDMPDMISDKIDEKFGQEIGDNVSSWLNEHVTPSGSAVVVDDTLSITGAAADAKKVGEEISGIKEDFTAVNDELYIEKTLPLSTKTTASGQISASKYWAYKIPLNVGTVINKIAFPNSTNATGTIKIYLAILNGTTFTIINSLGTFSVTTGNNEYDVHAEVPAENTYIILKADYGVIGYTGSGGFDKLISVTYSDGVYTVNEQLAGWGLILNIGYLMSRLDKLEDKIGDVEEKSVIKVAEDGSGDFTTINAAMSYADTYMSKAKPVTILVYPGTYEEVVNAYGRRNLSIIGINRDTCIIRDDTGDYSGCPLRIEGNSYVANLTLISTHKNATNYIVDNVLQYNPSYALHIDDRHPDDDDDYVCTIENCRLYCEQNPAIGIGLDKNQTVNIINCEIETKETADMLAVTSAVSSAWGYKPSGGAVFYHALYSGNYTNDNGYQKLVLKDNIIKSNIPNAVAGEYGGMMNQVEFTFVGNSGYSTNNGKVWNNPLTSTTLNPISSGNNITSMNAD